VSNISTPVSVHSYSISGIFGFLLSDGDNISNIYGITSPLLIIFMREPGPKLLS
jgi:hypothetical protein